MRRAQVAAKDRNYQQLPGFLRVFGLSESKKAGSRRERRGRGEGQALTWNEVTLTNLDFFLTWKEEIRIKILIMRKMQHNRRYLDSPSPNLDLT
jgi:hypothetical protein